jgi:uncharacterized membrane protein YdjX (TVP38/TMEM64 family)
MIGTEFSGHGRFHALRTAGRALLALLLIGGAIVAWRHRTSIDPLAIKIAVEHSSLGVIAYLGIHVVASLILIPRTIMGIAAGLFFGIWWGLVWAGTGMVLGTAIGLLVARYLNSGFIELESFPRIGPLLLRAERGGWRSVAIFRLIPGITHSLGNYLLGITRMPFASLMLGSFIGQLPSTFVYVYLGEVGESAVLGESHLILQLSFVVAMMVGLLVLGAWFRRRSQGWRDPRQAAADLPLAKEG